MDQLDRLVLQSLDKCVWPVWHKTGKTGLCSLD